ncbi:MAG TPA: 16S rRNA (cytidine(1402)-2'-O)-methyltransferase, partial [Arenibaculum sp.]|nr:16S rRNA (cytidine(1402)-2'-O)-methyltransferase [Arenibaculum sp.]
ALGELAGLRATLVFFESAQRLSAMLGDAAEVLGPREAAVARELTKLFEEVRRGPLDRLAAHYAEAGPPRGEVVVAIGPPEPGAQVGDDETVDAALRDALEHASVKDAAAQVAAATGRSRREVYARALDLSRRTGDRDDA